MTRSTLRITLLAVVAAATLTACDSASDDEDLAQFEADVTGDATAALEGQAAYAVMTEDGQTVTAVGLINEDDEEDVVLLVVKGQPRTGTFEAAGPEEEADAGMILTLSDGETGALYTSTAGSITVTRATTGRLVGRFDIDAVNVVDEEETVSVEGTFDAKVGEVETDPGALSAGN
ncbi:MAG TPA: hypothetical protein VF576_11610 [Rubricoccaceae bacterium]